MSVAFRKVSGVGTNAEFDRQAQQIRVPPSTLSANQTSAPPGSKQPSTSSLAPPGTTFLPCPAALPRLMFPRCSNENDVGPVELARRESQHFLHNTEVIVSQRDETRQLSKELIAQVNLFSISTLYSCDKELYRGLLLLFFPVLKFSLLVVLMHFEALNGI